MWIKIEKNTKKWFDTLQLRVDVRKVPALCFRYKTYHSMQNESLYSENKNLFWKTLSKIFKTQKNSKTTHVREVFFWYFEHEKVKLCWIKMSLIAIVHWQLLFKMRYCSILPHLKWQNASINFENGYFLTQLLLLFPDRREGSILKEKNYHFMINSLRSFQLWSQKRNLKIMRCQLS